MSSRTVERRYVISPMKLTAIETSALDQFAMSIEVTAPARGYWLRPSFHRMPWGRVHPVVHRQVIEAALVPSNATSVLNTRRRIARVHGRCGAIFWNECLPALLDHMVRIGSRKWSAAQVELLTVLIDAGTSAPRAAVVLKRSVVVVRAKARNLGKCFRLPPRVDD
jgi:hypothetical protein